MGFLTDPNSSVVKGPIFALLIKHQNKVCFLVYVIGVVWFAALAYKQFNAGTYFSENALLPGLVEGSFKDSALAQSLEEDLRAEQTKYKDAMPYPWLLAKFQQFGIEVYTHNFTLNYPFGHQKQYTGRNVYGILRARRGDSTESIVLSAPFRPPTNIHDPTLGSVALMLALAKHFREQPYWAKDVIFLFTAHEKLGAQAWLEAYHQSKAGEEGILLASTLPARAGVIQACVNLELASVPINYVDIRVEGLNGQLPNLDLVNLAHRLAARERVRHTLKERLDHPHPETWPGFLYSLKTLLSMMATHATGVGSGNHALFHRYGIQSLTLFAGNNPKLPFAKAGYHQLGRVLEGMMRSLNNLLERFHQSFFFYLQPASNRYISIGVYMIPFSLIGGVLAVRVVCLWIENLNSTQENEENEENKEKKPAQLGLLGVAPLLLYVHVICLLLHCTPRLFSACGHIITLPADDAIYFGLLSVSIALLFLPKYLNKHLHMIDTSRRLLKCVACFELGLLAFSVAMYNISLALIVVTFYAPAFAAVAPTKSRLRWILQLVWLLLIHPMSLLLLFVMAGTILEFPGESVMEVLYRGWVANRRALMYSVTDGIIYGNWSFSAACVQLLPTWLLAWILVNLKSQEGNT